MGAPSSSRGSSLALALSCLFIDGCRTPSVTQRHVIDEAGKVPAAAFFSNPTLRSPVLSPDGTRIAGIRSRGAVDSIIVFPGDNSRDERELVITEQSWGESMWNSPFHWHDDGRIDVALGWNTGSATATEVWSFDARGDHRRVRQLTVPCGAPANVAANRDDTHFACMARERHSDVLILEDFLDGRR